MLKNDLENRDTDQTEFEAQFKNIQNEQENVTFTSNDAFFNQDQEEAQKDAELDEYYSAYFGNKDKMQKAFTAGTVVIYNRFILITMRYDPHKLLFTKTFLKRK